MLRQPDDNEGDDASHDQQRVHGEHRPHDDDPRLACSVTGSLRTLLNDRVAFIPSYFHLWLAEQFNCPAGPRRAAAGYDVERNGTLSIEDCSTGCVDQSSRIETVPVQSDTIQVSGIRCERCVNRLAVALEDQPGLEFANANLMGRVTLGWDDERTSRDVLVGAMSRAGFRPIADGAPGGQGP